MTGMTREMQQRVEVLGCDQAPVQRGEFRLRQQLKRGGDMELVDRPLLVKTRPQARLRELRSRGSELGGQAVFLQDGTSLGAVSSGLGIASKEQRGYTGARAPRRFP